MQTDTIKLIEECQPPTWTDQNNTTYKRWLVTMQTGKEFIFKSTVDANKNPQGSFRKAVGDSVTYQEKGSTAITHGRSVPNAKKMADPKPYAPTVFKSGGSNASTQNEIRASVALNNAIQIQCADIRQGKGIDHAVIEENTKYFYKLLENTANGR